MSSRDAPWCPPIVEMSGGMVGHLLAWEMHERDGSWHAWVSWIQQSGGRHVHKVVDVRAGSLRPLEHPDAYSSVPRRVRGSDGLIRPWSGETGLSGRKRSWIRGWRRRFPDPAGGYSFERSFTHRRGLIRSAAPRRPRCTRPGQA